MAKQPSIEEAVERARRAQSQRLEAVREVATKRQELADLHEETARLMAELQARQAERVHAAELADVRAYNAALSAGWSLEELKKIGLGEPEKKTRARRRSARRATTRPAPDDAQEAEQQPTPPADESPAPESVGDDHE